MASETVPRYQPYIDVLDYKFKSPPYTAVENTRSSTLSTKKSSLDSFPQFGSDLPTFLAVPTTPEELATFRSETFISIPTPEELASIIRYDPPPPPYSSQPPSASLVMSSLQTRRSRRPPPTMLGLIYENGGMAPDVPLRNPLRTQLRTTCYSRTPPTLAGPGIQRPTTNEVDEYEGPRGEKLRDARMNRRVDKKGRPKKSQ